MKKHFLQYWAECSAFTTLHVVALAVLATGLLLALSAEELGPSGPMTIVMGIAMMALSFFIEAILVLRLSAQFLAKKLQAPSGA